MLGEALPSDELEDAPKEPEGALDAEPFTKMIVYEEQASEEIVQEKPECEAETIVLLDDSSSKLDPSQAEGEQHAPV